MKKQKIKVGIICGGKSTEHSYSIDSAKCIYLNLSQEKYDAKIFYIDQNGNWLTEDEMLKDNTNNLRSLITEMNKRKGCCNMANIAKSKSDSINSVIKLLKQMDIIFPMLHGLNGEDGSIQGLLQLIDVPFVGENVITSAIQFDKDIAKRLVKAVGVNVAEDIVIRKNIGNKYTYNEVVAKIGLPFFVKPVTLGGSIGISKVSSEEEYQVAIKNAFVYDNKVLLEKSIECTEFEVGVISYKKTKILEVAEIETYGDWFSFERKYQGGGYSLIIPANITEKTRYRLQEVALQVFDALECKSFAKIDLFVSNENEIVFNEINTMPGLTLQSTIPKLCKYRGISYTELLDILIQNALECYNDDHDRLTQLVDEVIL